MGQRNQWSNTCEVKKATRDYLCSPNESCGRQRGCWGVERPSAPAPSLRQHTRGPTLPRSLDPWEHTSTHPCPTHYSMLPLTSLTVTDCKACHNIFPSHIHAPAMLLCCSPHREGGPRCLALETDLMTCFGQHAAGMMTHHFGIQVSRGLACFYSHPWNSVTPSL